MQPCRIQLVDLTSGDTYLAAQRPKDRKDIPFDFYPESFAHIRENCIRSLDQTTQEIKIQTTRSKTLYIIDEIGPLERNKGHLEFLKVVLDSALADALVLTVLGSAESLYQCSGPKCAGIRSCLHHATFSLFEQTFYSVK
ncbi:MAG: hypothetical protein SAMD01599839_03440 [Rectinema sp.]